MRAGHTLNRGLMAAATSMSCVMKQLLGAPLRRGGDRQPGVAPFLGFTGSQRRVPRAREQKPRAGCGAGQGLFGYETGPARMAPADYFFVFFAAPWSSLTAACAAARRATGTR
jgi:hypothetical protein